MALNIKNAEVERLAAEVASAMNETKTEAIRRALLERKARVDLHRQHRDKGERLDILLKKKIWPSIPKNVLGKRISKQDEDKILGFGPEGF